MQGHNARRSDQAYSCDATVISSGHQNGLCVWLSSGNIFRRRATNASLFEPRNKPIAPADRVADLAMARHTTCLIKRCLLKLAVGCHKRQTVGLADLIEELCRVNVCCSVCKTRGQSRESQSATGEDQNPRRVRLKVSLFCISRFRKAFTKHFPTQNRFALSQEML